ncbi:MAG: metallophosphoesterase family protein [Candidatus Delongbacteria bacterium]|nr:metallophosphoesterase family protein [Candidatus Delongbacteria bacterium]
MKPCRFSLSLVLLLGLFAIRTQARILQQPQFHRPEFILAGDSLSLCIMQDSPPTNLVIQLHNALADRVYSADYIGPYFNRSTIHQYRAGLDGTLPEGLYDIAIFQGTQLLDSGNHAVRIYHHFPDTFHIAHISDTHLPNHRNYPTPDYYDENTLEEVRILHQEFQWINPELVIHTGDVIDWYMDATQYEVAAQEFLNWKIPIIILPGNHDFYEILVSGIRNWKKHFSDLHDYTAHFNRKLLIGLAAYEQIPNTSSINFTEEQLEFVREVLEQNNTDQDRLFFFHYDFNNQVKDRYASEWQADQILYGHTHSDADYWQNSTLWLNISQTGSSNLKYRWLTYAGDSLISYPVIQGGHLSITPLPVTDPSIHAFELSNQTVCRFERARIETVFPADFQSFGCSRGQIVQRFPVAGDSTGVTVLVELKAQTTDTVYLYGSITGIQTGDRTIPTALHIHPNPATDRLTIRSIQPLALHTLQLYSLIGRKLVQLPIHSPSGMEYEWIVPPSLPSGIYLLRIETASGPITRKITILH